MKFVTAHEDLIHDVQLDFYGKRLATCSSDRLIKVYEADDQQQQQPAELIGHNGPVWQVAWAHPKFGNILASCSYDRQVIVWKELAQAHWVQIYQYRGHDGSVNSISWCPPELGLCLACASSDESTPRVDGERRREQLHAPLEQTPRGCHHSHARTRDRPRSPRLVATVRARLPLLSSRRRHQRPLLHRGGRLGRGQVQGSQDWRQHCLVGTVQ
ncbi:secretory protein 13, partial [Emiliania huxleyi CCMP1516]|uniref:GATOR complex protein SEC13 n=2 Tax=Emiliania huxleyi TaxID=2903 RepID=A0A0D3JEF0_EMIH1